MYLFPSLHFTEKYINTAKKQKFVPDAKYCLDMLEATGVVIGEWVH